MTAVGAALTVTASLPARHQLAAALPSLPQQELPLFGRDSGASLRALTPPQGQLLKWVGSKQRFAAQICATFPKAMGGYYEPFIGSAAVLATLAPAHAVAADALQPLIQIWQTLQSDLPLLLQWYTERWQRLMAGDKVPTYLAMRRSYNETRDPADLLFLVRACYGGVVRFAKDGSMNTPCGIHRPIAPEEFERRAQRWQQRVVGVRFVHSDFEAIIDQAQAQDVVYCDPPYSDSQNALYGAQLFSLTRLFEALQRAKDRGAYVALSIDGTKRSGTKNCDVQTPDGLFATDLPITVGRSMLRRFQMGGQTLEDEVVKDRLLLSWTV